MRFRLRFLKIWPKTRLLAPPIPGIVSSLHSASVKKLKIDPQHCRRAIANYATSVRLSCLPHFCRPTGPGGRAMKRWRSAVTFFQRGAEGRGGDPHLLICPAHLSTNRPCKHEAQEGVAPQVLKSSSQWNGGSHSRQA